MLKSLANISEKIIKFKKFNSATGRKNTKQIQGLKKKGLIIGFRFTLTLFQSYFYY